MSLDSKHVEVRFSPNATDSLYLLVAQVPRPRDMSIFVLTKRACTYKHVEVELNNLSL